MAVPGANFAHRFARLTASKRLKAWRTVLGQPSKVGGDCIG